MSDLDPRPAARLAYLVTQLYKIHPVGGPLHVVLDDHNLDGVIQPYYDGWTDADLDADYYEGWSIADLPPEAPAVVEGLGVSTRALCDEIAALLNGMTVSQREAAAEKGWRR